MRRIVFVIGLALTVTGCVAEVGEDVGAQEEQLYRLPPGNVDGDACCAKDYREGDGDVVLCGERDGLWCCTDDGNHCASCNYYECEPAPEEPTRYTPSSGTLYRAF